MMSGGNCAVCKVVGALVGLGALNWGLVGIFQMDLVAAAFGAGAVLTRLVYGVIGVAGLLKLCSLVKCCPCKNQETAKGCGSPTKS